MNIDNIKYDYKIVYTLNKNLKYHYIVKKPSGGRPLLLFDSTYDSTYQVQDYGAKTAITRPRYYIADDLPFDFDAIRIDWIIKHVTNANKYPPRMSNDGHYLKGNFDLPKPKNSGYDYSVRTVHYELFKTMLKLIVTNIEDKNDSDTVYTICIEVEYSTIVERSRLDDGNTIVRDAGIPLYRQFTYLEYFFDRFITIRETLQAQGFTRKLAILSIAGTAILTETLRWLFDDKDPNSTIVIDGIPIAVMLILLTIAIWKLTK